MTTLDALAARLAAGADRIAAANRYPMRVRQIRPGAVGEYVLTRGEMIALRDLLGVGIAAVGERL